MNVRYSGDKAVCVCVSVFVLVLVLDECEGASVERYSDTISTLECISHQVHELCMRVWGGVCD